MMKKTIIAGSVFTLMAAFAQAQAPQGLDSIIVERYYVSDANDATQNSTGGALPVNSVTYRIYADLKPGYTFQAAYGVDIAPTIAQNGGNPSNGDHLMEIKTSTAFFNNYDRGATTPTFTKAQAAGNTVMLDSWLSCNGAASNALGIMKSEDNGVANVTNIDGVLQNNDPFAGIPLTTQDGFTTGSPFAVTFVGINADVSVFDDTITGSLFSTYNGSWAALGGSTGTGPDNKVLIAQITTDGVFSFKLNLQLGTPTPGQSENWVAENPTGNEATHPTLIYMDSLTPVGIAAAKLQVANFSVYPNPTTNMVTIDIDQVSKTDNNSITIYSVDGKQVSSQKLSKLLDRTQQKVDMTNYPSGLYFVEVIVDGMKSTKKVVKN